MSPQPFDLEVLLTTVAERIGMAEPETGAAPPG